MLAEYRNKHEFLRNLIAIDENKRFALYDIYRNPEQGTYDTMCVGDVDSFINHGRLFRSVEDALARHEAIKSIFQLHNNNVIFNAETGEMLINTSDDGMLKRHGIVKDKDDNLVLWTLSLSHFEEDVHHGVATAGLFAVQVLYKDGTFLVPNFWEPEELEQAPAPPVLFATYHEAEEAIDNIKPMLDDKPHPIDYWLSEDLFRVDLDERCFYRDSSKNLPDFFFDTYAPELNKQDSRVYAKLREIVECDEGLYLKAGSNFGIEVVIRGTDTEWHFRGDKVLVENRWIPIKNLYSSLGINTETSLLEAFNVNTETVVLTSENLHEYVGRTLATSVFYKWIEEFVDEDMGDIVQIERRERLLPIGEVISEKVSPCIELFQGQMEVRLVKDDEEMNQLMNFVANTPFEFSLACPSESYDEWESNKIDDDYFFRHTRLSEIGRKRLDKALYGNFSHSNCRHSQTGFFKITPRDFIEIVKMLAKFGKGYHLMTDVPAYPTTESLSASDIADFRNKHLGSWAPNLSTMVFECLEIDYLLHQ